MSKPDFDITSVTKLHQLLRIALDDAKQCVQEGVALNGTSWISQSDKRCSVCLAGAVLYQKLGPLTRETKGSATALSESQLSTAFLPLDTLVASMRPGASFDLRDRWHSCMEALDYIRVNELRVAVARFYGTVPEDWVTTISNLRITQQLRYNQLKDRLAVVHDGEADLFDDPEFLPILEATYEGLKAADI